MTKFKGKFQLSPRFPHLIFVRYQAAFFLQLSHCRFNHVLSLLDLPAETIVESFAKASSLLSYVIVLSREVPWQKWVHRQMSHSQVERKKTGKWYIIILVKPIERTQQNPSTSINTFTIYIWNNEREELWCWHRIRVTDIPIHLPPPLSIHLAIYRHTHSHIHKCIFMIVHLLFFILSHSSFSSFSSFPDHITTTTTTTTTITITLHKPYFQFISFNYTLSTNSLLCLNLSFTMIDLDLVYVDFSTKF